MSIEAKMCKKCIFILPIVEFEKRNIKLKNGEISTNYRHTCKKCKVKENKQRIAKDPDFYKKQYISMSEEKRSEYIKKKSDSNKKRFIENPQARANKKKYDLSDRGIYKRYIGDSKRRSRLERNIEFSLTFEQFSILVNSSCSYCKTDNCRGVDRIDSNLSYTESNSVPCCKTCNRMKSDMSLYEFLQHIKKIQTGS